MAKLPDPECKMGYTVEQVESIMGDRLNEFNKWMFGQTRVLCQGRSYNHDTREYKQSCGGVAHGGVTFSWDVEWFLEGRPIID